MEKKKSHTEHFLDLGLGAGTVTGGDDAGSAGTDGDASCEFAGASCEVAGASCEFAGRPMPPHAVPIPGR